LKVLLFLVLLLNPSNIAAQGGADPLPADVHGDSRNRLPLPKPGVNGVQAIRLHGSGADVRWNAPVGRALSELAILATAREHDVPYEWSLHEMEAVAVGLDPAVIDIVRHRRPTAGLDEKVAVIVDVARELFGTHRLPSVTYARALRVLGKSNLVDVVLVMGNYAGTGTRLTAFNQQMPAGWMQFLPLPFTPPDDIHPDTRSRLPYLQAAGPEAAPGPLYSRVLAPEGTGPAQIRRHAGGMKALEENAGRRTMSLAVIVTSHEHHQPYHWNVSEAAARKDGVEAALIDIVRRDLPLAGVAERDAALIQFGRELFRNHTVNAATYQRALKAYGERDLVDLVDLMAREVADVTVLTAFDQR
jgi:4-carboxymuconolactone decarboxylase